MADKKIKVLQLDDDPRMREIVKTILDPLGYQVDGTDDHAVALAAAGGSYDLVMLSMIWPAMEHMDLGIELYRGGYKGGILVVTPRNLPLEQWDVFKGLGFGLLLKPFGPRDLLRSVRATLAERA